MLSRRHAILYGLAGGMQSVEAGQLRASRADYRRYEVGKWNYGQLVIAQRGLKDPEVVQVLDSVRWPVIPVGADERREIEKMLELQAVRVDDVKMIKAIFKEYSAPVEAMLEMVFGDSSDEALRATMADFAHECTPYILAAKLKFSRERASQIDSRIKPFIPDCGFPTFPSGHTTQAWVAAEVISVAHPSKRRAARMSAIEFGLMGEYAGSHFPSDSLAGERLAGVLIEKMKPAMVKALHAK